MKRLLFVAALMAVLFGCNNKSEKGKFVITGLIKNAPNQKIYLEELFFSEKNPEVIDTAEIKNGKFTLTGIAPEEGLYRLRMEKDSAFFILINDKEDLSVTVDYDKISLENIHFNSAANAALKKFILGVQAQRIQADSQTNVLEQMTATGQTDSALALTKKEIADKALAYQNYIVQYIDTTKDAVVALFALGYSQNIAPEKLQKAVNGLATRFPKHLALNGLVAQYNQMVKQRVVLPHEGGIAPEINLADTSGKPFALSMLRGKYVLVDFWASWCGPCREENPNVVKAYNTFKDKNFTVLGVSLDKEKQPWLNAIKSDSLTWHHISDLKFWNSAAVALYGFNGIPYNVLVDPAGKIIAMNLRGEDLQNKLREILK